MNEVLAGLIQRARAEFARGTTAGTRRALAQARQVDRAGELDAAFWVYFEAACLLRDNKRNETEQLIRSSPKLTQTEWTALDQLLATAPENKYPPFLAARQQLRSRIDPGANFHAPQEVEFLPPVLPDSPPELRPVHSGARLELIATIATDLSHGKSRADAVIGLVAQGWAPDDAAALVDDAASTGINDGGSPQGRRSVAKSHLRHMLFGLVWIAAGIGAIYWDTKFNNAVATAEATTPRDSLVRWAGYGATGWGAIDFFRGLFGWIKYSD